MTSNPVLHRSYLCRQRHPLNLTYVHIIKPRVKIHWNPKKGESRSSIKDQQKVGPIWTISFASVRRELGGRGGTVLFSADGYNFDILLRLLKKGEVDTIIYGRYRDQWRYSELIIGSSLRIRICGEDLRRKCHWQSMTNRPFILTVRTVTMYEKTSRVDSHVILIRLNMYSQWRYVRDRP
jgi:hypothetical protein